MRNPCRRVDGTWAHVPADELRVIVQALVERDDRLARQERSYLNDLERFADRLEEWKRLLDERIKGLETLNVVRNQMIAVFNTSVSLEPESPASPSVAEREE